jgi:hypothetical protein
LLKIVNINKKHAAGAEAFLVRPNRRPAAISFYQAHKTTLLLCPCSNILKSFNFYVKDNKSVLEVNDCMCDILLSKTYITSLD